MRVIVAPDSFGGTMSAVEASAAIADGWRRARPDDDVVQVPLADGGEGTLEVVHGDVHEVEVADPLGRPRPARWMRRRDGTAIIESAQACGLALLEEGERDPLRTTTYGVGQLLEHARADGARRIAVGLGGSATVDGGAGALLALGVRALRADGQGVKVGGGELATVERVDASGLDPSWGDVEVILWSDVRTALGDAATVYGPQKGAGPGEVARLEAALRHWADVVERDLDGRWRHVDGSGAAGGLGFGLLAALGAATVSGARAVADIVGLPDLIASADLVVTGEGTLDRTSGEGKVVGVVRDLARDHGTRVVAVVGRARGTIEGLDHVEEAAPHGPGDDPAGELAAASVRAARRTARPA